MQRLRRDDGAIAVMVAVLMVALLGFGALVVDVGQIYAERRQLQNGADAAALAVAEDCPRPAGCDNRTVAGGMARKHADPNANDNESAVTEVCGTGPNLSACAASTESWDCRPTASGPAASASFAQVRTQTLHSGSSLLPGFLVRVLDPSYSGTTVRACARASWGPVGQKAASLAMTVSYCEWKAATSGGTTYAPPPPYPPKPAASYEHNIFIHTTTGEPTCGGGQSGWDLPGGFGWLDDGSTADCATDINVDNTYGDKTGVGTPTACKTAMDAAYSAKNILYLPVYDGVQGSGGNGTYHLKGFAAFVLTGWSLAGGKQKSWLTNTLCGTGTDKCISGFFTSNSLVAATSGVIGDGAPMGVTVVQMTG